MKLPFTLSISFVFRVLLPGFVLAVAFSPIIDSFATGQRIHLEPVALFLLSILVLGWLVLILDKPIYMVFEGRRFWPQRLRHSFLESEKGRLRKIKIQNAASAGTDLRRHRELSVELRRFPMSDHGDYEAQFPTRLGNLMTAYEQYPRRIYGMDSIFYWYRIWLTLDDKEREELDRQQAVSDSVIYTSAALYAAGILCLLYLLISGVLSWSHCAPDFFVQFENRLLSPPSLAILVVVLCGGGYTLYRLTLHVHAHYGELYKALFDVKHEKLLLDDVISDIERISGVSTLTDLPRASRMAIAWRYLHNYRIKTRDGLKRPSELPGWQHPYDAEVDIKSTPEDSKDGPGEAASPEK